MESLACVHVYRLDTPQGETVRGVCKLCGAERTYSAWPVELERMGEARERGYQRGLGAR